MTKSKNIYKPKVKKTCPICGRDFWVLYCRKERKYCSKECSYVGLKSVHHWWHPKTEFKKGHKHKPESIKKMSEARKGKPGLRGKKNPNWKGGKRKRYIHSCWTKTYKKWRLAVFNRDEYTCAECNVVGGNLKAHHLKSWAEFPKLRYIVGNGVTLCDNCHKQIHKDEITIYKALKLFYDEKRMEKVRHNSL